MADKDALFGRSDTKGAVAHVWDADTGAQLAELRNDASEFPAIAFSADGRWLATSGGDDVRVFDTNTWAQALTLAGPRIRTLSFDPNPRDRPRRGQVLQQVRPADHEEPVALNFFQPDLGRILPPSGAARDALCLLGERPLSEQLQVTHSAADTRPRALSPG